MTSLTFFRENKSEKSVHNTISHDFFSSMAQKLMFFLPSFSFWMNFVLSRETFCFTSHNVSACFRHKIRKIVHYMVFFHKSEIFPSKCKQSFWLVVLFWIEPIRALRTPSGPAKWKSKQTYSWKFCERFFPFLKDFYYKNIVNLIFAVVSLEPVKLKIPKK